MSYTVIGTLSGRRVSWTWDAGRLTGDPLAVRLLQIQAEVMEGEPVGFAGGPISEHAHLADPIAALALTRYLPTPIQIEKIEGDVPRMQPVPAGAEA